MGLVIFSFVLLYAVGVAWVMYLAIMNLLREKDHLTLPAKVFGYPVVVVGLVTDAVCNITLGSLLFMEFPREWLFTFRLERHLVESDGWRYALARWCCVNLLDPFDPRGRHCA